MSQFLILKHLISQSCLLSFCPFAAKCLRFEQYTTRNWTIYHQVFHIQNMTFSEVVVHFIFSGDMFTKIALFATQKKQVPTKCLKNVLFDPSNYTARLWWRHKMQVLDRKKTMLSRFPIHILPFDRICNHNSAKIQKIIPQKLIIERTSNARFSIFARTSFFYTY